MKRLLIISPYFPPVNTADMQRVRMSLPYFEENGWQAEVVAVDQKYTDLPQDELLAESIPAAIKIHLVKAFGKKWTSKFGFGSISYRSWWYIRQKVNELLSKQKFDLIYFSTTQFQVCMLGAYWKKRFGVPYVIDMQDPWHSEYYRGKPKQQQPPKYWLSYRLNKYLEPIAMKEVDGLISVSDQYIEILKGRYPRIKDIPSATITFGIFEPDLKIAAKHLNDFKTLLDRGVKNIVYIGRGGMDMYNAIKPVFESLKMGLPDAPDLYNKIRLYFIGTSYAPNGQGSPTILPLAKEYGLEKTVVEITDRIGYYHTLITLQQADALFMPGSDDPQYTASKIYPYLLTHKPLLAMFNAQSSALNILNEFGVKHAYSYDKTPGINAKVNSFFRQVINGNIIGDKYNTEAVKKYSARMMTKRQCDLFNPVIMMKRYVQYGCGFTAPAEWVNYDASPTLRFERLPLLGKLYTRNKQRFPKNVNYGDIVKGLPEKPDSCDDVYCSHILEHLAYEDFLTALKNTYLILKPGGTFRGVVPDLRSAAINYIEEYEMVDAPANEFMRNTMLGNEKRTKGLSSGIKGIYGNSKHLWMWDYKSLQFELKKTGFINIRECKFGDPTDPLFKFVEEEERFFRAVAFECQK